MTDPFGWSYPAGAENDPSAPYNDPGDGPCDHCGHEGCECMYCPACDEPSDELVNGLCPHCREDVHTDGGGW